MFAKHTGHVLLKMTVTLRTLTFTGKPNIRCCSIMSAQRGSWARRNGCLPVCPLQLLPWLLWPQHLLELDTDDTHTMVTSPALKRCSSWPGFLWLWLGMTRMVFEKLCTFGTCQNVFPKVMPICAGKMKGSNCLSPGGSCWCSGSMNLALTTCHYLQRFGPAHLCREGHLQQNCRYFWDFHPDIA